MEGKGKINTLAFLDLEGVCPWASARFSQPPTKPLLAFCITVVAHQIQQLHSGQGPRRAHVLVELGACIKRLCGGAAFGKKPEGWVGGLQAFMETQGGNFRQEHGSWGRKAQGVFAGG